MVRTREGSLFSSFPCAARHKVYFGNLVSKSQDFSEWSKPWKIVLHLQTRRICTVQLRERGQKASETVLEPGQDIRTPTNSAYPTAPCDLRETLAIEQFVAALINSEMRLHTRSTAEKVSEQKNNMEEELKFFTEVSFDMHHGFEGWKRQRPNSAQASVMTIKQQEMLDLNQIVLYVGQKST